MLRLQYGGEWDPSAFKDQTFHGVDFSNRCLVGADFSGSVCKDCDFTGSDLSLADFSDADLYRSDFSKAILYAARFDNANLTRANFSGAFTYGWLLNASANIAYANLLNFDVEDCRRKVDFGATSEGSTAQVAFGETIGPTRQVCQIDYQVGDAVFRFDALDAQEAALQRSQIYTRLKRLYRENQLGELALHCLYLERCYLTRSYYRGNPLVGGPGRENALIATTKTGFGFLAEWVAGYGLKPWRLVRTIGILALIFYLSVLLIVAFSSDVQLAVSQLSCEDGVCTDVLRPVRNPLTDAGTIARFTAVSMVDPGSSGFHVTVPLSSLSGLFFYVAIVLYALLFSSVFLRLLND